MELKIADQARGTRIISGAVAKSRRNLLNRLVDIAESEGFEEILLPSVEPSKVYVNKAGADVLEQMYVFPDKKHRQLCLRPECTATIQLIADKHFRRQRDLKLWYFERCWRYEKPQKGRYREFFQFGVEVLNPSSQDWYSKLIKIAESMVSVKTNDYVIADSVRRGLDYYTADGFEISVERLGPQRQVVGGGAYRQGMGFAIGFDRLMLC
ncbi:MAG: ATP phosphoribosyltransferase regulatory subunit [Gammaproteobacteria bacterium]|nr:ATP phosphoribosyltransferase regulatory subunit [Gammaproteobacteria bacterium]MDH5803302.1 ATP phosphoribosyltransferase regulatory subunit [Gammaproteobacteria bacterium]